MNNKKLDRIIELLESIDSKLGDSSDSIMDMNAMEFAGNNHMSTRIKSAINRNAKDWTVRDVYYKGKELKNFGNRSIIDFRRAVDTLTNNQH